MNTQGLNWRLMSHAHKLRCLIQQARSMGWALTMLTDLHFCEDDWQSNGYDTPQVVYLEEYALVQWFRVGFLLDCPTRQRWEDSGRLFHTEGQRSLFLGFQMQSHTYHFGAVYAPVQSEKALRREFFAELGTVLHRLPRQHLLIGGDWNGHLGRDSAPYTVYTPQRRQVVMTCYCFLSFMLI